MPTEGAARGLARPGVAAEVAPVLLDYLGRHLNVTGLRYRQVPVEFPDGWETYTYAFQLRAPVCLPRPFEEPLVLRIYASVQGLPRAWHEWAVQRHLRGRGFPVTEPILLKEKADLFGGPFLLRAKAHGHTLLQETIRKPWKLATAPGLMAAAHVQLHRLPVDGFPAPPGCLLDRSLADMAATCRDCDFPRLLPGLDWLREHRPAPPTAAHVLHLDFHPMNLIYQADRPLTVLDWTEADVGDVHADVGTTLMLMDCVSAGRFTWRDHLSVAAGRVFFTRWYLTAYQKEIPLDEDTLAYYRAWAALRRLCQYGRWLREGPAVNGSKDSLLERLAPRHLAILERYVRNWTGVVCYLERLAPTAAGAWRMQYR